MVPCLRLLPTKCVYMCAFMLVELLRLDAHRTSNTIKQWKEWNWLLSLNVIKPIQPTKTGTYSVAALPPPSFSLFHAHTHAHTSTHPVRVQTQSKGLTLPLIPHCLLLGSDHWSWCAHHVLGLWCTAQSSSAALYCGISGRPFNKHPLREPVSEVPIQSSQKLLLPMTLSFRGLGSPPLNPKRTLTGSRTFLFD